MVTAALLWSLGSGACSAELSAYAARPDPAYAWIRKDLDVHRALRLTSLRWQGADWRHDVVLVRPNELTVPGSAIIEVTGWAPNKNDYALAQRMADAAGMTVAILFQVPNQPLSGYEEDALIAHTFEKFLETGDPERLLLFPMVKSVKAAMDALHDSSGGALRTFVVTGASKRGWTTWLAGETGDARIVGIAPRVFDNLDFRSQLRLQKEYWGEYSPMIRDYTDKGLQDLLETESGKRLVALTDPFAHVGAVTTPVLVATGTNDPYWTVDSTQVYWDKLPMPKWSIAVPNAGHGMGSPDWWAPTVGRFARACALGSRLPKVDSRLVNSGVRWELRLQTDPAPASYKVWKATSSDMHFHTSVWSAEKTESVRSDRVQGMQVRGEAMETKNLALMVEFEFATEAGALRLTTPVYVVRKR